MIYLPDGCEANAITFILPSNNCLNVDFDIKASENKFSFNRSYSKIENVNLMQALNISNFCNTNLWTIANKIPEMEDSSIFNIKSTLTKLGSFPTQHWSAHIPKIVPTILTPLTIVMVFILIITIYCNLGRISMVVYPNTLDTRHQCPSTSNDMNQVTTSTSDNSQLS